MANAENNNGSCSLDTTYHHVSRDRLSVLRVQESTRYGPLQSSYDPNHEEWRRAICEWCFQVVDYYSLNREVVSIALFYIDRFISIEYGLTYGCSSEEFQLLAMTSLYVAVKIHGETDDGKRRVFPMESFANLSGERFSITNMEWMERRILETLEWKMNPPTPARFLECFYYLFPAEEPASRCIFDTALYITELSVCSFEASLSFKPSVIAYVAILSSMNHHKKCILPKTRNEFLKRAALATCLFPETPSVLHVQGLIAELWEENGQGGNLLQEEEEKDVAAADRGSSSPVCVRAERQRAYDQSEPKRVRLDE